MTDTPQFAEFTVNDGNPVSINVAEVASFTPSDDHTLITLTTGQTIVVRESFDLVTEALGGDGPSGS